MRHKRVNVIGAGLAGSEAAYQLARRGIEVRLYEMRPEISTGAHVTGGYAELVCSNSFGSTAPLAASALLKSELLRLDAYVVGVGIENRVPAGASLAVDRERFSQRITQALKSESNIQIQSGEVKALPRDEVTIVATGPLTTPELSKALAETVGQESLYFYDAISPIVTTESLDHSKLFRASRYDKGEADFLNIPLTQPQYETLVDDLLSADLVIPHQFEEEKYFESCLPIETLASRGRQTLAYGPLKPVGLRPPDGSKPYAVVQLRTENKDRTAYNLVGFQTRAKYPDQVRIFRKLPGLEQAEFVRLGSIHRNTYVDSPRVLTPQLQLKAAPHLFLAGQLTGTEGYLESTATGWIAAMNAYALITESSPITLPKDTMLGALISTITDPERTHFQPMNANMAILPALEKPIKKKALRREALVVRAKEVLENYVTSEAAVPLERYTRPKQLSESLVLGQE